MKSGHSGVAGLLTAVASNLPLPLNDDGIRYVSQGTVLVLGPAERIVAVAKQLARTTRVVACSADRLPPGSARANPLFIPCRIRAVRGYLGQFRVDAEDLAGNPLALAPFSSKSDGIFDLLLDLSPAPFLTAQVKAPGYFSPPPDELDDAIDEMLALKGSFRKPRFLRYDAELCTHGAQGVQGCTRCLDVCPAQAIVSTGDRIEVNAHLCHGCSTCTLVCPTGALSHTEQSPEALLKTVAERLLPGPQRLCIHEAGEPPSEEPGSACLGVPVIAAAGAEIWFSALALGFQQVLIQLPDALPPSTREAIAGQLGQAHELLDALGLPAECIVGRNGAAPWPTLANQAARSGRLPAYGGKRAQLLWAFATLQEGSDGPGAIALKPGADLGSIAVDTARCTLCLACSQLCPTGALLSPAEHEDGNTHLEFIEGACVQCGLCERACPEQAISRQARFLLHPAQRHDARVLNRDQQHHCPQCGAPFINKALLAKATQIMRRQGGLDDAAIARLSLCPDCRLQQIIPPPPGQSTQPV
jgi:ferredoxin